MTTAESLRKLLYTDEYSKIESMINSLSEEKKREIWNEHLNGDRTLLHYAVVLDNPKMVSKLVELGADVNVKSKRGNTPLRHVQSLTVAKILVANGADVNAIGECNYSILYHCLVMGRRQVFEFLLNNEETDLSDLKIRYRQPEECTKQELYKIILECCRLDETGFYSEF